MNVLRKDDNISIYNLTKGKALPEWLPERKRRRMQQADPELARRIELIQDFGMPIATTRIKISGSGQYIFSSGVYKPRIRCYDTKELAIKFERHLDAEIVSFESLSDDYSKIAMLLSDRSIELHARYGYHYKTRIPKAGRDIVYHYPSCDLFIAASSPEIYRLNLDTGTFMQPLVSTTASAVNVVRVNPYHGLVCAGTDSGHVECFDPRTRGRVGVVDVAKAIPADAIDEHISIPEISALACFEDGLQMAVGTISGHVLVYDIRSSKPLLIKDHNNGLPIKDVVHHSVSNKIISADTKGMKIWDPLTGDNFTSIETAADINSLCVVKDSGLIFAATEATDVSVYFIPSLAPAPQWASYLDSITEELEEEEQAAVYDDFKFVTRDELEQLKLSHLIGSNILRAYMHGFFMDAKLYAEAKAVVNPFAYQEYRKARLEKLLDEGTAKRVELRKAARKLPQVNKFLAERLLKEGDGSSVSKSKQKRDSRRKNKLGIDETNEIGANPMQDDRFKTMFDNQDFEIDQESEHYTLLHPSEKYANKGDLLVEERFSRVDEDDEESEVEGKGSDAESSEDEKRLYKPEPNEQASKRVLEKKEKKVKKKKAKGPKLFELNEDQGYAPGTSAKDLEKTSFMGRDGKKSFKKLLKAKNKEPTSTITSVEGGRQSVFRSGRRGAQPGQDEEEKPARRGVGQLGLKKESSRKYWRGHQVQ
eukprot:m.245477 g.245477  ORF g.245477 m.245477 type:complete len:706 (-) comp33837_c3_seq16:203-2320(-)